MGGGRRGGGDARGAALACWWLSGALLGGRKRPQKRVLQEQLGHGRAELRSVAGGPVLRGHWSDTSSQRQLQDSGFLSSSGTKMPFPLSQDTPPFPPRYRQGSEYGDP